VKGRHAAGAVRRPLSYSAWPPICVLCRCGVGDQASLRLPAPTVRTAHPPPPGSLRFSLSCVRPAKQWSEKSSWSRESELSVNALRGRFHAVTCGSCDAARRSPLRTDPATTPERADFSSLDPARSGQQGGSSGRLFVFFLPVRRRRARAHGHVRRQATGSNAVTPAGAPRGFPSAGSEGAGCRAVQKRDPEPDAPGADGRGWRRARA